MRFRLHPASPGRLWLLLAALVTLFALVPALIERALPASSLAEGQVESVELGTPSVGWTEPIGGLNCRPDPEALMGNSYGCNGGRLASLAVGDVSDPVHTLDRMVRSEGILSGFIGEDPGVAVPVAGGEQAATVKGYPKAQVLAIATPGEQEHEGLTLITMISGPETPRLAAVVWQALYGETLPEDIEKLAVGLRAAASGEEKLPQLGYEGTAL